MHLYLFQADAVCSPSAVNAQRLRSKRDQEGVGPLKPATNTLVKSQKPAEMPKQGEMNMIFQRVRHGYRLTMHACRTGSPASHKADVSTCLRNKLLEPSKGIARAERDVDMPGGRARTLPPRKTLSCISPLPHCIFRSHVKSSAFRVELSVVSPSIMYARGHT